MRLRRVALLTALLAATLASPTSDASAADYSVVTCHRGSNDVVAQNGALWYAAGGASIDCPTGLSFNTNRTLLAGERSTVWYAHPNPLKLKHLKFTLEGGDTSTGLRLRLASNLATDSFAELPPRATGDPPLEVDLAVPNVGRLYAYTQCVAAVCSATNSPLLHDFEFTYADDTPPVLSNFVETPALFPGGPMLNLYGWNKPGQYKLEFNVIDSLTGVARASVARNAEAPFWTRDDAASPCRFDPAAGPISSPQPCPSSLGFSDPVDLRGLPDGYNELRIHATDAIGNSAYGRPVGFYLDGTPPAAPQQAVVDGLNANGWTSRGSTPLRWVNPGETTPTPTQSGLTRAWYDVRPNFAGGADPVARQVTYGDLDKIDDLDLPGDGEWIVRLWVVDAAGNEGEPHELTIGRDTDVPSPPGLTPHGWVSAADLRTGLEQRFTGPATAGLESGLCGYAATVNRQQTISSIPGAITIEPTATDFELDPTVADGVSYVHVAAESCAGLRSRVATTELRIDKTAPEVALSGLPGGEWSPTPLKLIARASDAGSGVSHSWLDVDGGPRVEVSQPTATLQLRDGLHRVKYGASDVAGGVTERVAMAGVDTTPPEVVMDPLDPADPVAVSATVTDTLSGLDSAWLEYSRVDSGASDGERGWRVFGQAVYPAPGTNSVKVSAVLPDAKLPDGTYALRAVGIDVAGNSGHGTDTLLGSPLLIALPARQSYTLGAKLAAFKSVFLNAKGGACKPKKARGSSCRRRTRADRRGAASQRRIEFADSALLMGSLRDRAGHGISGAELLIYEKPSGGPQQLLTRLRTGQAGDYELKLARSGTSRTLTAVFAGNGVTRGAQSVADLAVSAGVTLQLSRVRAHVGQTVRFTGRILSQPGSLPSAGRRVAIEYLTNSGWQPLKSAAAFPPDGGFEAEHTFGTKPRKPIRFKFRAYLDAQPNWPFAAGVSRTRSLVLAP